MLAAMTHPGRVLNLDMKAKLCMPKSNIYIYILLLLLFWQTALHIAVEKGHEEIVEYLLEKGADIHATDDVR